MEDPDPIPGMDAGGVTQMEEPGTEPEDLPDPEPMPAGSSEETTEKKKTAKKTVAYMVKEFEMKKSADAYARASESKTGSLDMSKLHTYKYNEDLFLKVTTLPGATNHGMMMVLDWSGSMADNLKGTLAQLYNLIWFCRRTKICLLYTSDAADE